MNTQQHPSLRSHTTGLIQHDLCLTLEVRARDDDKRSRGQSVRDSSQGRESESRDRMVSPSLQSKSFVGVSEPLLL